jgi:hypothetical protein
MSVQRTPIGVQVSGWAEDPDTAEPITVTISGGAQGTLLANGARNDQHTGHGFSGVVPAHLASTVCASAHNAGNGNDRFLGCQPPAVRFNPIGNLELAANVAGGVRVAGWALDPDTAAPVALEVRVDGGKYAGTLMAGLDRPEGGWGNTYLGYGSAHGFDGVVTADPERDTVCVYAINTGQGEGKTLLGCRDPRLSAPSQLTVAAEEEWGLVVGWNDNTNVETGYRVEVQRADGAWVTARRIPPVEGLARVKIATPDSGYHCVRVSAFNAADTSKPVGGCGSTLAYAPPASNSVNVASLNVLGNDHTALGWGYPRFADRLEAIAKALSGFDVVLLQEVSVLRLSSCPRFAVVSRHLV